ncbi:MAG: NADH-quinone oxidoreductase subunit A [Lentisphaerae bacterium]|nr:NADH-quinone oxidoreductase subunit A [Lentisphaerota bacterium]
MNAYAPLLLYLLLGPALAAGAILVGKLLGIRSPQSDLKHSAYECGVEPFGNARIQFKAGYYLFALLFLVFDIETVFLFPCVTLFRSAVAGTLDRISGAAIFAELSLFVIILLVGLIYAWRKGALKWE